MAERNSGLVGGGNKLKLGVFGANCSGGLSFLDIPDRWAGEWDDNVGLAKLADAAGLECLLPGQQEPLHLAPGKAGFFPLHLGRAHNVRMIAR